MDEPVSRVDDGRSSVRWGLVEEPSYAATVTRLSPNWRHLDSALSAITWSIARHADDDARCPVVNEHIRLARAALPTYDVVIVHVYFSLDRERGCALLEGVDVRDPGEDPDGSVGPLLD